MRKQALGNTLQVPESQRTLLIHLCERWTFQHGASGAKPRVSLRRVRRLQGLISLYCFFRMIRSLKAKAVRPVVVLCVRFIYNMLRLVSPPRLHCVLCVFSRHVKEAVGKVYHHPQVRQAFPSMHFSAVTFFPLLRRSLRRVQRNVGGSPELGCANRLYLMLAFKVLHALQSHSQNNITGFLSRHPILI